MRLKSLITCIFLFLDITVMAQNIRKAAVAGKFYAADKQTLDKDISRCYGEASVLAPIGKAELGEDTVVQAVIVPHAGYVFSGAVAASAFLRIAPGKHYDRIFLIGPSHHVAFSGASVDNAFDACQTPLGNVPVDKETCGHLLQSDSVFRYMPSAHDQEHCLEVQLPLLQYRMQAMPPIVPIIIGTQDMCLLVKIAKSLKPYLTPNNLFVISSDFSHYPSYKDALTVDGNTGKALEAGRIKDFIQALEKNNSLHIDNLYTSACGQSAITVLLLMAQDDGIQGLRPGLRMRHIAYLNSGDSPYGGKDEVVGYHSFVLTTNVTDSSASIHNGGRQILSIEDKRQLLNLAWNAISPVRLHKKVSPTDAFNKRLGVFVTLTKHGRLRGCIGHFGEDIPLCKITEEMARAAAFEDPRFPALKEDELNDISIEISVLTPLRRIHDIGEFQYGKQGIYMRKGWRSGTFLPQVAEEVDWSKEEFLGHCAQDKAGIGWNGWKTAELYTYEAIRFGN